MLAADQRLAVSIAAINVDLEVDPTGATLALDFQGLNQIVGQGLDAATRLRAHAETAGLGSRVADAHGPQSAGCRSRVDAAPGGDVSYLRLDPRQRQVRQAGPADRVPSLHFRPGRGAGPPLGPQGGAPGRMPPCGATDGDRRGGR